MQNAHQDPNRRIPVSAVCDLCGGVSSMTLWRWMNDPQKGFPRPIYVGRRRYWREADVIAWLEARETPNDGADGPDPRIVLGARKGVIRRKIRQLEAEADEIDAKLSKL